MAEVDVRLVAVPARVALLWCTYIVFRCGAGLWRGPRSSAGTSIQLILTVASSHH